MAHSSSCQYQIDSVLESIELSKCVHQAYGDFQKKLYFFLGFLPISVISAVAALISSTVDSSDFKHKDFFISLLSLLNGIFAGIAAYWNWQGSAEKHAQCAKSLAQAYANAYTLRMDNPEPALLLKTLFTQKSDAEKDCPPIPLRYYKRWHAKQSPTGVGKVVPDFNAGAQAGSAAQMQMEIDRLKGELKDPGRAPPPTPPPFLPSRVDVQKPKPAGASEDSKAADQ